MLLSLLVSLLLSLRKKRSPWSNLLWIGLVRGLLRWLDLVILSLSQCYPLIPRLMLLSSQTHPCVPQRLLLRPPLHWLDLVHLCVSHCYPMMPRLMLLCKSGGTKPSWKLERLGKTHPMVPTNILGNLQCRSQTHPLLPQLLTSDDAADLSGLAHGRGGAPQPALSVASTSMVSGASTPGSFAAETSTSDSDVEYMIIPDTDYVWI